MPSDHLHGLLVLPGWGDHGRQQYEALKASLRHCGWRCQRVELPDSSWPEDLRKEVTREDALRQALEDYQQLDRRLDGGPITVLGFSFGAYIATYLAASCQAQRLILRSPALYPDEGWTVPKEALDEQGLMAYRNQFHDALSNEALHCCEKFKGDVLLVDSENDEVIPRPVIASYEAAFASARSMTRHTVQGADHPLTEARWQNEYLKVVLEWLRNDRSR